MFGFRTVSVLLASLALGCSSSSPPLLVLAAASLSEVLREIAETSTGSPAARFSFAGSQTLVTQVRQGVRADVIAVADPALLEELRGRSRIGVPRVFAGNRMVWVSRAAAGDERLRLSDLDSRPARLVLAAPDVPAGAYARAALEDLGLLEAARARLVSQELDVRGVISKLQLAGADAGIAYATDLPRGRYPDLVAEPLPESVQPRIAYAVAVVSHSRFPGRAQRFAEGLSSPRARAILRSRGFRLP